MSEGKVKQLALKNITADPALQMRDKGTDPSLVDEYAEAMKGGAEFPPLVVYHDATSTNWLSQGFTRLAAAEKAGLKSIAVEIRAGNRKDAIIDAAGSNGTHGLRRTNADKRRAAAQVITEFPDMPNTQVADIVGVSDTFVGDVRKRLQRIKDGLSVKPDGAGERISDDLSVKPSPADAEAEREARIAAVKKLDGEPDPTAVEDVPPASIEQAGAPRATEVVNTIVRALHLVQAEFSGLYAGRFAEGVRNTSKGYNAVDFYDTGEAIEVSAHGGLAIGMRKLSCDSIDNLLGFCGGLKLMLARVEHEPTGEQEYQEKRRKNQEFLDAMPELSAKLRQDDDVIPI